MKVVLMAGGRGTRISELFPDIPKPLIPINNIPVIEREIISLRNQGFTDIILTIGYMAEKIRAFFGNGEKWDVKIEYFVEQTLFYSRSNNVEKDYIITKISLNHQHFCLEVLQNQIKDFLFLVL